MVVFKTQYLLYHLLQFLFRHTLSKSICAIIIVLLYWSNELHLKGLTFIALSFGNVAGWPCLYPLVAQLILQGSSTIGIHRTRRTLAFITLAVVFFRINAIFPALGLNYLVDRLHYRCYLARTIRRLHSDRRGFHVSPRNHQFNLPLLPLPPLHTVNRLASISNESSLLPP